MAIDHEGRTVVVFLSAFEQKPCRISRVALKGRGIEIVELDETGVHGAFDALARRARLLPPDHPAG